MAFDKWVLDKYNEGYNHGVGIRNLTAYVKREDVGAFILKQDMELAVDKCREAQP